MPRSPKPPLDPAATLGLLSALSSGDSERMANSIKGLPPKILAEAVALLRQQANEAFARGAFKDAADLYTQALSGAPTDKALYSNRSLTFLRMGNAAAALEDANEAVKLDPDWVKGHYRKGAALMALNRGHDALPYLRKVAALLPEDKEVKEMLDKANKEEKGKALASSQSVSLNFEEGDAVTLPRKVWYPTQDWFLQHQIGQGIQRQLQAFSDLDSPRRLITSLSDPSDLIGFWLAYLSRHAKGSGRRCLMIGSMGGVAPFHVKQGFETLVVVERYAWVAAIVRGIVGKNLLLRKKAGEGDERHIVVSRKRPLELLQPQGEGEEDSGPFDAVYWLDWEFSLLGSGVVKVLRAARQKDVIGKDGLGPMRVRVLAVGIQILLPLEGVTAATDGEDKAGGLERMLWEVGPAKMELPTKAYRVLTEEVTVWDEPDVVEMRPKQQPTTLPLLPVTQDDEQPRRIDAIVYWYQLHLPCEDGAEQEAILDSSRFSSIGRGLAYLDPMVLPPSQSDLKLIAYRSESQLGFWPCPDAHVNGVSREYRLPRWYPDMLLDDARNTAYQRAITRVCKDRRVLDVGSGTGLLSVYARRAGAGKVLGCEEVVELADVSKRALGPEGKVFVKDVRRLKLTIPPNVVMHEVFDAGLLGEGVLHLLEPHQHVQTSPPLRMLPARATVYAQLLQLRFDEIGGVNVTLLNPYRFRKDYETSPCHGALPMSEPFVLDRVDFSVDAPGIKPLRPGIIRASQTGIVSAVRLWFVLDFGDGEGQGEKAKEDGSTVLDSRDGHWGYALLYLPEARFEEGDMVPIAATRSGADYSIRMPEDLVRERLCGTPRFDQAWLNAEEQTNKTTSDVLERVAMSSNRNESKLVFRVAYRLASHPAEFGLDPLMASRFFHNVMAAKKAGRRQQAEAKG